VDPAEYNGAAPGNSAADAAAAGASYLGRMPLARALALGLLYCTACAEPAADAPDFEPVADVKTLMTAIIEPAAETYWDAVGWIIDEDGTHELKPRSVEEWDRVRNAAFVLAESGNLLMLKSRPMTNGRPGDDAAWQAFARAMIETGRRAIAAAETRNADSVFTVGGEVYEACTACHGAFALETLRPSHQR
jgi:hypothetical protein